MANAPLDWNDYARMKASERWRIPSGMMGRDVTRAIVARAELAPDMKVLDVASGSGEPAISMAVELKGTGLVIATDISTEPLMIAVGRAEQRGLTNIQIKQADVHALTFPDELFDRVTSRLGAMFFANIDKALSEIHRVLKPNGKAILLAWGPMSQPYFETTIGTVLREIPGSAVPSSGANMFRFADPEDLRSLLLKAGFREATADVEVLPWTWPGTAEDAWGYFQSVTIPFRPLLQSISESRREEIDRAVINEINKYQNDERIEFTCQMVMAVATR